MSTQIIYKIQNPFLNNLDLTSEYFIKSFFLKSRLIWSTLPMTILYDFLIKNTHTHLFYTRRIQFLGIYIWIYLLISDEESSQDKEKNLGTHYFSTLIEEISENQNTVKEILFFPVACKNTAYTFTVLKKLEFTFSSILDYQEIFFKCLYFISVGRNTLFNTFVFIS